MPLSGYTFSVARRWLAEALWFLGLAAVAAGDYLLWLGWHRQKHLNSAGTLSGPYETWQVLGVVAVLAAAVVLAARRRHWVATAAVPITATVVFSIEAATDSLADGLWPVGALLLLLFASLGTWLVAYAARLRRGHYGQRLHAERGGSDA